MAFLSPDQEDGIKKKMFEPESDLLGTEYRGRKNEFYTPTIPNSNLDKFLEMGYRIEKEGKTKTKVSIRKPESTIFEDQVWCQFYELGFRILNKDNQLVVKWGDGEHEHKQLDVVAIDEKKEVAFVVECKAAEINASVAHVNGMARKGELRGKGIAVGILARDKCTVGIVGIGIDLA